MGRAAVGGVPLLPPHPSTPTEATFIMAPKLNPEYTKMLKTPARPIDGPRKQAVESLQKQIDFHVREANQLKYSQNLHNAISRLPPELLVEAFLYVVDSGLEYHDTRYALGTFSFLQVCRHWNEVAVGFPQLWSRWVAGGFKAWPIFSSRSRNVPICLTWRPRVPSSARYSLLDPTIPKRIRQLDLSGTSEQLETILGDLGALDLSPCSNLSSIRLHIFPHDSRRPQVRITRFLSSSFPKLSQLDLASFLPDLSSPVLTTSRLTSLKLFLPYGKKNRYTLSQFSHILQRHPNLLELDLNHDAIPQPGSSGSPPIFFTLPHLVTLRLYGTEAAILGFLDFVGMSSPLHDVVVRFSRFQDFNAIALASTVKKILVAYYECQGLDHLRKVNHITISSNSEKAHLAFATRSHPVPTPNLRSNLRIQFNVISERDRNAMVQETIPLFPLDDLRGLAFEGSALYGDVCAEILWRTKNLSHLRLDDLDIWPALDALTSNDPDGPWPIPKLESLTLSHLDVLFGCEERLLDFLRWRYHNAGGLKKLVVRSCRVHGVELEAWLRELVAGLRWDNVRAVGPDYKGSDDDSDTDEDEDEFDDDELERYYISD